MRVKKENAVGSRQGRITEQGEESEVEVELGSVSDGEEERGEG